MTWTSTISSSRRRNQQSPKDKTIDYKWKLQAKKEYAKKDQTQRL